MLGKCIICKKEIQCNESRGKNRTCGIHSKDRSRYKEKQKRLANAWLKRKRKEDGFLKTILTIRTERMRPTKIYNWSWIV